MEEEDRGEGEGEGEREGCGKGCQQYSMIHTTI